MKRLFLALLALAACLPGQARVELPPLYGDGMVLQQQTDLRIRGRAEAGSKVVVRPSWGSAVTATAGRDGRWTAVVRTPEAGGPHTILFDDGEPLTLRDVLVGEVWFCSGQSNMEMPVRGYADQPVEGSARTILTADPATPIRICRIARATARTPQATCRAAWERHTPEAVAAASATAYFFARQLQEVLRVPVGIVVSSWGGTCVESWMDRESLAAFPEFDLSFLDGTEPLERPHNRPTMLYNAMVAPAVQYPVRGFIWYQGESNRGRPAQYRRLMPAFVRMLRERWGLGELPFYYVQIAPYKDEGADLVGTALLREAQLLSLGEIPASGMATTLDIGSRNCIHPARKREVGERLAFLALTKTYSRPWIDADAPVYESMEVVDGKACLTFRVGREGLAPLGETLTGFEVAGADRVFHPATAQIARRPNCVVVTCDSVPEPVAVRYCFRNWAEATLFNNYGIPASSFRTDDWEIAE